MTSIKKEPPSPILSSISAPTSSSTKGKRGRKSNLDKIEEEIVKSRKKLRGYAQELTDMGYDPSDEKVMLKKLDDDRAAGTIGSKLMAKIDKVYGSYGREVDTIAELELVKEELERTAAAKEYAKAEKERKEREILEEKEMKDKEIEKLKRTHEEWQKEREAQREAQRLVKALAAERKNAIVKEPEFKIIHANDSIKTKKREKKEVYDLLDAIGPSKDAKPKKKKVRKALTKLKKVIKKRKIVVKKNKK
jgi:hypothetical protein